MTEYSALSPVSVAVYALLNVPALLALAPGGATDDIPQAASLPLVFYEVEERDVRGFGTGGLPEVTLRVHVYSDYQGMKEGQVAIRKVIELLKDQSLTIVGYNHCGKVFYDQTALVPDTALNGVKVHELVAFFRIYAEQQ